MLLPVKPLDFEITTNDDFCVAPDVKSARVLVRWQDAPIGVLEIPVVAGRVRAADVKKQTTDHFPAAFLRELARRALLRGGIGEKVAISDYWHVPVPEAEATSPDISIAVCTRDRADDLEFCLESLAAQSSEPLEVLVIDNAPATDATERLVRENFPQFRYVREDTPGLDHARNRAIREAKGEVIAFTDDDVVADRGWTAALGRAFAADPSLGLVTGLIEPVELETPAQVWFERYGGFGRGCFRHYMQLKRAAAMPWEMVGAGRLGAGANMAMRRVVFDEIGLFDPALDVGTPTRGGGDHEIFFRMLRSGWLCLYEPCAVVRHRHRRTMGELRGLLYNYGYATRCFLEREACDFPEDRLAIQRLSRWWWRHWAMARWFASAWCPDRFPGDLVKAEIKGFIDGRGGYRRARQAIVPDESARPDAFRIESDNAPKLRNIGLVLVDVDMPLRALPEGAQCESLDVVVRWRGRPLGRVRIPTLGQTVSIWRLADMIAERFGRIILSPGSDSSLAWSEFHAELGQLLQVGVSADPPAAEPSVSIIIATCNRPESLRRCLGSLLTLRYGGRTEIIVVDNRPAANGASTVVKEFPGVRLIAEDQPGSSYARNAGVSAANYEIIAMTDDDMEVSPDWLIHLVEPFSRADVYAVTGNTLAASLETPAERDFEKYGGFCRGFSRMEFGTSWFHRWRRRAAPTWWIGGSGNAAFRSSIFSDPEIGTFMETLGAGVPAGVGEDTMMFYQILRAGGAIIYDPAAIAWHHHRVSEGELQRQIFAYSKGHVAYHLLTLMKYRDRRALTRILAELPLSLARRGWQRLRGRGSYPWRLLATEIGGTLLGPWALWRSHCRVREIGPGLKPLKSAEEIGPTGISNTKLEASP
jgi:GT2 family glycosyltransferase